jgi:hypothetical protein
VTGATREGLAAAAAELEGEAARAEAEGRTAEAAWHHNLGQLMRRTAEAAWHHNLGQLMRRTAEAALDGGARSAWPWTPAATVPGDVLQGPDGELLCVRADGTVEEVAHELPQMKGAASDPRSARGAP